MLLLASTSVSADRQDDYLERVKAEIRAEADAARVREPLPRIEPLPRAVATDDSATRGIDRERREYAIGELVGVDHRAFLDQAFRSVLKRPPDDAGSELQARRLGAGASKAEILGNLRWSPEGRRVGVHVRGLLPRYLLAKAARVPVLGFFVDWALAFAGLPLLMRHQRAADTSVAARFEATADLQRDTTRTLDELRGAHGALTAEHDRRSDALRADIGRMLLRLDTLEQQANRLEGRVAGLETRTDADSRELAELRHYVHAANHWVASLQRSLGELEDSAALARTRADTLTASIAADADASVARAQRHAQWSAALATRLPAGAHVLDLGSGDGAWLAALAGRGIGASGVEDNAALAAKARARDLVVAAGDPLEALARCEAAGLDALCVSASTFAHSELATTSVLGEALRVLRPGATLLLRYEEEPHRLTAQADTADAPRSAGDLLVAAGFVAPLRLPANGGTALLAERPRT